MKLLVVVLTNQKQKIRLFKLACLSRIKGIIPQIKNQLKNRGNIEKSENLAKEKSIPTVLVKVQLLDVKMYSLNNHQRENKAKKNM